MTTLFTRLPVSAPGTIGTVASTDIQAFSIFDPEAYGFWKFNLKSLKSVTDSSKTLTTTGSPTFSGNTVTLTNDPGEGLESDLNDSTGLFSFSAVVDLSVSTLGGTLLLAGSFYNANTSTGAGVYVSGSGDSTQVNLTAGGSGKGVIIDPTKPVFIAVSVDSANKKVSCLFKQDGLTNNAVELTMSSFVASGKNIALGSYIGAALSNIAAYEFAVYDEYLSASDLDWKFQLAKARMADVNVTL